MDAESVVATCYHRNPVLLTQPCHEIETGSRVRNKRQILVESVAFFFPTHTNMACAAGLF